VLVGGSVATAVAEPREISGGVSGAGYGQVATVTPVRRSLMVVAVEKSA
jgi:hypothetical protein